MPMKKPAIDRRIVRTRATLQHALNSLILKKRYESITITDICDAANVGRSTFYAHYTSKDDLKRSGFERLRSLLVERQKEALTPLGNPRDPSFGSSPATLEHTPHHNPHIP